MTKIRPSSVKVASSHLSGFRYRELIVQPGLGRWKCARPFETLSSNCNFLEGGKKVLLRNTYRLLHCEETNIIVQHQGKSRLMGMQAKLESRPWVLNRLVWFLVTFKTAAPELVTQSWRTQRHSEVRQPLDFIPFIEPFMLIRSIQSAWPEWSSFYTVRIHQGCKVLIHDSIVRSLLLHIRMRMKGFKVCILSRREVMLKDFATLDSVWVTAH